MCVLAYLDRAKFQNLTVLLFLISQVCLSCLYYSSSIGYQLVTVELHEAFGVSGSRSEHAVGLNISIKALMIVQGLRVFY